MENSLHPARKENAMVHAVSVLLHRLQQYAKHLCTDDISRGHSFMNLTTS